MYEWFERTGYAVDRAALARAFPAAPGSTGIPHFDSKYRVEQHIRS
jgi:hypothetical protein